MIEFLIKQIEATEKTIKSLQEHAESLRSMLEKETPKKWSPVGGDFFINVDGSVEEGDTEREMRLFGLERPTQQQAERAAVEMRRFNRLLALRDELCGDEVVDWSNNKETYFVFYSKQSNMWKKDYILNIKFETPLFTSHDSAQKACDMLNSGEVEL